MLFKISIDIPHLDAKGVKFTAQILCTLHHFNAYFPYDFGRGLQFIRIYTFVGLDVLFLLAGLVRSSTWLEGIMCSGKDCCEIGV